MSEDERVIVLVPSERDMTEKGHIEKFWPNFVHVVKFALEQHGVKCRVMVAGRKP